jgi:transcriptional regulator with XRE-family HTH domain
MIHLEDLLALRKEGLTYQKIADKYGVNKSIIWKMINKNIPEMKIGNKSRVNSRPITKIWKEIDGQKLYDMVEQVTISIQSDKELIKDVLLNYIYHRNQDFIDKFHKIPDEKKAAWLYKCFKLEILNFYSHKYQKEPEQFSVEKYDKEQLNEMETEIYAQT